MSASGRCPELGDGGAQGRLGASATVKGSRISESRIMVLRARVDRAAGKVEGPDFTGVAFRANPAKPCRRPALWDCADINLIAASACG